MHMCTAPSSSPEDFQAGALDSTSISLSWSPPLLENQNGIIRHYEVTLIALETEDIHIQTSTALSITITSLHPYTTYNCTVAAETVETGPVTIGLLVQTLQAGTVHNYFSKKRVYISLVALILFISAPSAPPEEVQVLAVDSKTLELMWQPPDNRSRNGIIQRYHINITELDTQSTFLLETTALSVVVDNLHPYYSYSCSVAAETVELGPFSVVIVITLPEDCKPLF